MKFVVKYVYNCGLYIILKSCRCRPHLLQSYKPSDKTLTCSSTTLRPSLQASDIVSTSSSSSINSLSLKCIRYISIKLMTLRWRYATVISPHGGLIKFQVPVDKSGCKSQRNLGSKICVHYVRKYTYLYDFFKSVVYKKPVDFCTYMYFMSILGGGAHAEYIMWSFMIASLVQHSICAPDTLSYLFFSFYVINSCICTFAWPWSLKFVKSVCKQSTKDKAFLHSFTTFLLMYCFAYHTL